MLNTWWVLDTYSMVFAKVANVYVIGNYMYMYSVHCRYTLVKQVMVQDFPKCYEFGFTKFMWYMCCPSMWGSSELCIQTMNQQ